MVPKRTSKKALKVEEKQLRDYELVLVISPEVMDELLDTTIDKMRIVESMPKFLNRPFLFHEKATTIIRITSVTYAADK